MCSFSAYATLRDMQLIQIGETRQKTVLDMVQEMAMRQLSEIEQLKYSGPEAQRSPYIPQPPAVHLAESGTLTSTRSAYFSFLGTIA